MLKSHTEQLNRYKRVHAMSLRETASIEKMAGMAKLLQELKERTDHLDAAALEIDRATITITEDKNNLKFAAIEAVLNLGQSLVLVSERTKNALMRTNVTALESEFTKANEQALTTKLTFTLQQAQTYLGALKEFGVTAETVVAAQSAVRGFLDAKGTPKQLIDEIKTNRDKMALHFEEANQFFKNQVTFLAKSNKASAPEFFIAFENASKMATPMAKLSKEVAKPTEKVDAKAQPAKVVTATATPPPKTTDTTAAPAATSTEIPASAPERVSWKNVEPSASV
jgi:hypothetical protein